MMAVGFGGAICLRCREIRCSVADLDIQKCVSTFKKTHGVPLDKLVCLRVPMCLLKGTSEGCFEWTN